MVNLLCSGSWYQPPVSAAHTPCLSSCNTWDAMPAESDRGRACPEAQHLGGSVRCCTRVCSSRAPSPAASTQSPADAGQRGPVQHGAGAGQCCRAGARHVQGKEDFPIMLRDDCSRMLPRLRPAPTSEGARSLPLPSWWLGLHLTFSLRLPGVSLLGVRTKNVSV